MELSSSGSVASFSFTTSFSDTLFVVSAVAVADVDTVGSPPATVAMDVDGGIDAYVDDGGILLDNMG